MTYATLRENETISRTIESLNANNFSASVVKTKEEALEEIKKRIPEGASVMNGASTTLEQIGFIDYLKSGEHRWENSHEAIVQETDPNKKAELRKQALLSDYYLGSVHAVTEDGQLMIASNTGSQLPHLAFTSPNIILVVGTQKIVKDIPDGFKRIDEQVIPLEDERMKGVYGYGTLHAKTLILHKENPALGRSVHVLFVEEPLGF